MKKEGGKSGRKEKMVIKQSLSFPIHTYTHNDIILTLDIRNNSADNDNTQTNKVDKR